jgi:hypothetical protein
VATNSLRCFSAWNAAFQPGPLGTFPKWKKVEKALMLCMPVTCKRTKTMSAEDRAQKDETFTFTHFTYKSHWFVLSQTEGERCQQLSRDSFHAEQVDRLLVMRARHSTVKSPQTVMRKSPLRG